MNSRREFLEQIGSGLLSLALFDLLATTRALARPALSEIVSWLNQVNELARTMKKESISQLVWQTEMERLLAEIPMTEFLGFIDFEKLASTTQLPQGGEYFQSYQFTETEGLPKNLFFYRDLAGFRKGASIPPHGHNHLVSSFLVLKGELRGRHFDRVEDDGEKVKIRPTVDQTFKAGDFSTISQFKNNVHWFTANTEGAFIFDFGIGGLSPTGSTVPFPNQNPLKSGCLYLDVEHGQAIGDGICLATRLSETKAYNLYG